MSRNSPAWITRVVRSLSCIGLFAAVCGNAVSADLSGYWLLDEQRSDASVDVAALSAKAQERVRTFDPLKHDPTSVCMPYGMPRVMTAAGAMPMEIVQTDAQVTMIFDAHDEVRRIFLTSAPSGELAPLWLGYAYGKWEGATLVIDTIGLSDQSLIDATGIPHSEKLHVVERLRRIDANTLLDEMTLYDEDAFIRPVTRKLHFNRTHILQQREFHCAEQQWLDHVMARAKELTREAEKRK